MRHAAMPSTSFTYTGLPSRVVFGAGSIARLPEEIDRLKARRVMVLSTPGQRALAESIATDLGTRAVAVYHHAVMHVPIETVREAHRVAGAAQVDCLVAAGGGSTIGLAKAIALEYEPGALPISAIPTTYAGSEMTPIYGVTAGGVKRTGKDPRVLPTSVLYDPILTLGLPANVSVTSGLNAIAHAVEGLYARDGNPIMALFAEEGIRALASALPAIRANPSDLDARTHAQYGAWLCGTVLGNVGMALHHKLCHTLGGTFNLPHAETHAVILPHAVAFNAPAVPAAVAALRRALNCDEPAAALHSLALQLGAPTRLADIGMPADGIERAAELATQNPYWNPRPFDRAEIVQLLRDAYSGLPPHAAQ
jgi:maleylacetate reductase